MSVFGYIFLTLEKEYLVAEEEQQTALYNYAQAIGVDLAELLVDKDVSLKRPFTERVEGSRLIERCLAGDAIITMKAEWILSSAADGVDLLRTLRGNDVALYCIDLGQNITVDEKRKLIVSEGCAGIVQKILSALAVCESSRQGEAVRVTKRNLKNQGKYIGGPVPFGWEVNKEKVLVQNEAQQKIIQAIIQMREDRWSYRDISKKLKNEFDIQLSHAGVRRIMESDKKKKEAVAAGKNAD
jgi:DNA invertase Pin-like site-specific DNA recombinase